jgi:hypothetical protein
MNPQKLTRKFKDNKTGERIPFQYHARCDKKEDALDEKKALISEGHLARYVKDPVYGVYHIYVRVEDAPQIHPDAAHEAFDSAPTLSPGTPSLLYTAGLDKLIVSFHVEKLDKILVPLQELKVQINDPDYNKNPHAKEFPFEFFGGEKFNLRAVGIPKYPWVLEFGDSIIAFSTHKADAQQPNCRIEIGSKSCWKPGWLFMAEKMKAFLRRYGAEIVQEKITRCDLCVDLLDVEFGETGFVDVNRWNARGSRFGLNGEHYVFDYVRFGQGDISLKAYNKTRELKNDQVKHDLFHEIWREKAGRDVENVTRLEFKILRPIIKQLKIKSVYDLSRKLNSLWAYLVGDGKDNKGWAKFLDRPMTESDRENKNHQRYDIDALWGAVREVRFKKGRTLHLSREKVRHFDPVKLKKLMAGCGSSICGGLGLAEEDYEGHIKFACSMLEEQMRENFFKDPREYKRKITAKHNKAEINF